MAKKKKVEERCDVCGGEATQFYGNLRLCDGDYIEVNIRDLEEVFKEAKKQ